MNKDQGGKEGIQERLHLTQQQKLQPEGDEPELIEQNSNEEDHERNSLRDSHLRQELVQKKFQGDDGEVNSEKDLVINSDQLSKLQEQRRVEKLVQQKGDEDEEGLALERDLQDQQGGGGDLELDQEGGDEKRQQEEDKKNENQGVQEISEQEKEDNALLGLSPNQLYTIFMHEKFGKSEHRKILIGQWILLSAIYYAFIWGMESLASRDWIDAYSWVWVLVMGFFYLTWYHCRQYHKVHFVEYYYNVVFFCFFFGICLGIYYIVYHDFRNNRYLESPEFQIITYDIRNIQGEGGIETYGIVPVAFKLKEAGYVVGCGCFSDRARDDIFSGRPQVYRYTLEGENLDGNLLNARIQYSGFSARKLPAWKCHPIKGSKSNINQNVAYDKELENLSQNENGDKKSVYYAFLEEDLPFVQTQSSQMEKFMLDQYEAFALTEENSNPEGLSQYIEKKFNEDELQEKSLEYCKTRKQFFEVTFQKELHQQMAFWYAVLVFIQLSISYGCSWVTLALPLYALHQIKDPKVQEIKKKRKEIQNEKDKKLKENLKNQSLKKIKNTVKNNQVAVESNQPPKNQNQNQEQDFELEILSDKNPSKLLKK